MDLTPLTPITTLRVLRNVPLDNAYKDTIDFASVAAQSSFFAGKAKYSYSNLTPIRLQNKIRLPVNSDSLFDCNYVMWQNSNFGAKWFYAFIVAIDFININMCEISVEIDVLQTWMFDYTLKPSFVEREHIANDDVGANLVPENLELGKYVLSNYSNTGQMVIKSIVIAATCDREGNDATGGTYGGVYSGLEYIVETDAGRVNQIIQSLTEQNKSGAIVSIFMMPNNFATEKTGTMRSYTITKNKNLTNLNGYTPHNNKLFTYPYNFLFVTNMNGNAAEIQYEFFSTDTCGFQLSCAMSCNPQITLIPLNYKGVLVNTNEKMCLEGFPQCSYTTDTFKAWLAQNGSSMAVSAMSSAVSLGTNIASGNIGGVVGDVTGVAQAMAQVYQQSTLPPQAHGSQGSSTLFASGLLDFYFANMSITAEFAERIDQYFDMFGYATHEVKVPNTKSRPSWNYVKTIDCKATGSIPFNDMSKIKTIYDSGVTFWHGNYVGDYTRANK